MATKKTDDEQAPRARKLMIVLPLVVALAGFGVWFTVLRPGGPPAPPEPGEVVQLDPVHVNLADGRYLRLTMALQLAKDVKESPNGARAQAEAVDELSLRRASEMATQPQRAALTDRLTRSIKKEYAPDVLDVYYTEFITQ